MNDTLKKYAISYYRETPYVWEFTEKDTQEPNLPHFNVWFDTEKEAKIFLELYRKTNDEFATIRLMQRLCVGVYG